MIRTCCSLCCSLPYPQDIQITFNVSQLFSSSVFAGADSNVVREAEWHVSVLYPGSYDISGTFMVDDTTHNAGSPNLPNDFYLHLSIELTDDWVPSLGYFISRAYDGSLPLSNHEMSEHGISVTIEPQYWYFQQLRSLPDEFIALSEHGSISDLPTYMHHLLERWDGPIYFFPEPDLPPHWERRISDEGTSYFYNTKTAACRRSPEEAFVCSYFSSSSFKVIVFLTIWISDEHYRTMMKVRRDRNARHRILPMFRTCCQLTKVVVMTRTVRHQRNARHLILPAFRTRRPLTKARAMKIRSQKNSQHLKLPAFRIRRQREKFNLLKYAGMASPRIRETCGEHVGEVQVAHVDLKRIVIASYCLFMSIFFIAVIAVGRD
jgi:hypothetical protein